MVALFAGVTPAGVTYAGQPDSLEQGFQNPPESARPRVWWHWMNGNITKDGIRLDLEWMKRAGIGGFQNFDAALATPKIVEKRLVYMTPEWRDAFLYATTLADQLGLEMAIASSPGWSESGGPWVAPAQAMKKLVWSETPVEGGRPFTGSLPHPPSITGPFQNIPGGEMRPRPEYYADAAVVAYRPSAVDVPLAELYPRISSSGGHFNLAGLAGRDLSTSQPLPKAPANQKAWIQFEFAQPQTIRAFTLVIPDAPRDPWNPPADSGQQLEASDDGVAFRPIAKVPARGAVANTMAFPPVTARFFRVTFRTMPPAADSKPASQPASYGIAELALYAGARVNRFEEKAGFGLLPDLYSLETPDVPASEAIAKDQVIDLTSKMRADGRLDWAPPAGRWIVLRFGYSLLGITNHPASREATGLEVDKLNRGFVKAYIDNYLDLYKQTVGPLMGKRGLEYVVTDSYEAGPQNWTNDMPAEFARRRGYDMHPWMPVLTGRVVGSAEASERFLWDFRKTIGELMTEYHYEQIGQSLHERGMGRYSESHESGRAFIGDGMDVKRKADIPMSAMWTPRPGETGESYGYNADVRESASVAHIYGQNLAAAESMTAFGTAWRWSPETLKPIADKELACGLNRFVIHTSVHQPVTEKAPGLGLGPYGQWFTRLETWAELAKPWITYLARSSFLLQQGRFVADVAYFYGEDSNITAIFAHKSPDVPAGYNFDYVSADALLTRLTARGGRIATDSGMSYRVLALDPYSRHMSLPVLRKIRDLVDAGATVTGPKPIADASLADNAAEFRSIADRLWDTGKIDSGRPLGQALASLGAVPDFDYTKPAADTNLLFVHRRLADGDLYWVNNRNNRFETVEATFRVTGRAPELWRPVAGTMEPASYTITHGRTTVPLVLEPNDAVFVVFRKKASKPSRTLPAMVETQLTAVEGAWDVSFQPNRGAPAQVALPSLKSWSESANAGVKYFSGTATYSKTVDAPPSWFVPGARLWLDLGDVKNMAEVTVNGESLGIVWKTPFRVDVTGALKPGANQLQVKVTNLWVNRLIGDQQPGVTKKYTYTTQAFYSANSPLLPSGLLGPVRIVKAN